MVAHLISPQLTRSILGIRNSLAAIEQAGKNVGACLAAAGVTASDIVLTRVYVTDTDAFKQNADMRARYLGPESAVSTVNAVPKLSAGSDYLVEIEAVASVK